MIGPALTDFPVAPVSATLDEFEAPVGLVFVEWSDLQKCFHVIEASAAVRCNFHAWLDRRPIDYRPLALCASREEAHAFIREVSKLRPDSERSADGCTAS